MPGKDDRQQLVGSMETQPDAQPSGATVESPPAYSPGPGEPNYTPLPPSAPTTCYTEELPPPYTPSLNAMISCKVCHAGISIPVNFRSAIIKCPTCQEATPLRPAPAGKRYIRCICQCLLICGATSTRVICPRTNCRRILNLQPTGVIITGAVMSSCSTRAECAHCKTVFVVATYDADSKLARCGSCRRLSYVKPDVKRRKVLTFTVIGLIFLILGVGVTAATIVLSASGGFYVVWIGAFIGGIMNLIRGGYLASIPVSKVLPS